MGKIDVSDRIHNLLKEVKRLTDTPTGKGYKLNLTQLRKKHKINDAIGPALKRMEIIVPIEGSKPVLWKWGKQWSVLDYHISGKVYEEYNEVLKERRQNTVNNRRNKKIEFYSANLKPLVKNSDETLSYEEKLDDFYDNINTQQINIEKALPKYDIVDDVELNNSVSFDIKHLLFMNYFNVSGVYDKVIINDVEFSRVEKIRFKQEKTSDIVNVTLMTMGFEYADMSFSNTSFIFDKTDKILTIIPN